MTPIYDKNDMLDSHIHNMSVRFGRPLTTRDEKHPVKQRLFILVLLVYILPIIHRQGVAATDRRGSGRNQAGYSTGISGPATGMFYI